jgi:AraC-like DNA-binding protein
MSIRSPALGMRQTPSVAHQWPSFPNCGASSVETVLVRDGFEIVLSQVNGDGCPFHFEEPADVFGIGFHLRGGAAFDMEGQQFETKPLDVWAGAAPQGSSSTFRLPERGFRTVSLRVSPDTMEDLLAQHGQSEGLVGEMARIAHARVAVTKLAPLDAGSARVVEAMFATPYTGAARTLFFESCALGLLAAQIDAAARAGAPALTGAEVNRMHTARAWLDAHIDDPPAIVQLARVVGINDFKLKRSFKIAFGTTIFGYVRQRRMERAATHLHGGLSVTEAAEAAGYVCPRCFADAFRRHYGVLPSEVTRAALANAPANNG